MWRANSAIIWPELGASSEAGRRQGPGDLCPLPSEGPFAGPDQRCRQWDGGSALKRARWLTLLWGTDALAAEYQTRWSIWSWFPLSSQPPNLLAQFVVLGVDPVSCFPADQGGGLPQRPSSGQRE